MANPEHAWNLVFNSPYLLIANPLYNNLSNRRNNFGPDFNGDGHSPGGNLSNLNVELGPGAGHAGGAGSSGAMWEVLGSFEHHTISENPILIDNPAAGNVDPALVLPENNALPENNPPIAPVVAGNEMAPIVHPHFNPDERRFVIEFVAKRLKNEPLEEEHRIHEINFYDFPPQHLAANYIHGKPGILYFFTPVRRRSNGQAIRSIPGEWGGKWSRVGGFVQNIKSNDGVVFNIKSYKFVPKHPSPNDISWLMKEYSLSTEEIQPHSNNIHECVAVKLYRK